MPIKPFELTWGEEEISGVRYCLRLAPDACAPAYLFVVYSNSGNILTYPSLDTSA
jgi:hypothetical protein